MQTPAEAPAKSTHSFGLNQYFLHAHRALVQLLPHCFSQVLDSLQDPP